MVASPLALSTEYFFNDPNYVSNLSIVGWETFDGIITLDSADTTWNPTSVFEGLVTTDSAGNISSWNISAYVNSSPTDGMEANVQETCSAPGCISDIFQPPYGPSVNQHDFVLNNINPGTHFSAAGSDTLGSWSQQFGTLTPPPPPPSPPQAPTPEPNAVLASRGRNCAAVSDSYQAGK